MARPHIALVTLGCPKNEIDSEKIAAMIAEAGGVVVLDPAGADVIVLNTCGFIESAKQESVDVALQLSELRRSGRCGKLIVTGCLAQRYLSQLTDLLPEADAVIGLNPAAVVAEACGRILKKRGWQEPLSRMRLAPVHTAYLRISEGCDNRCAYCAIPLIRGPLRSRPMKEILAEAQVLVKSGARELCLVGQDITAYGADTGKPRLHELIQRLVAIKSLRWVRLLYLHPAHVYPDLIDTIARTKKVCRYVDLPLQHVNDEILAAMGRRVTRAEIETLVTTLRERIPGLTLRTTFIVGFPGETRAKFNELLRFVAEYRFDRLGAFMFSPEEDTPAAEFDAQVGDRTRKRRFDRLMTLQRDIAFQLAEARVGEETRVLIDTPPDETGTQLARSEAEAPDIDPVIRLTPPKPLPGRFIKVRITAAADYDLIAQPL